MEQELLKQSESPSVDKEYSNEPSLEEENNEKSELDQESGVERTKECVLRMIDE